GAKQAAAKKSVESVLRTQYSVRSTQYAPPQKRVHRGGAPMDLIDTISGSLMEGFLPAGWNLKKIDALAADDARFGKAEKWWTPQFEPVPCASFEDFDTYMGHEIAREIQLARQAGRSIAFILPVG